MYRNPEVPPIVRRAAVLSGPVMVVRSPRPGFSHELRGMGDVHAGPEESDDGRADGRSETLFGTGDLNVEFWVPMHVRGR